MYMNIAERYVHPRQVLYVREAFQAIIREVVDAEDLDLESRSHSCGSITYTSNTFF